MIHEFLVNKKLHRVRILERSGNTFLVEVNEKTVTVKMKNYNQGQTTAIEINGRYLKAKVESNQKNVLRIRINGKSFEVESQPKIRQEAAVKVEPTGIITQKSATSLTMGKDAVIAPIAGRIVLLKTSVGQEVEKGECICILEAMKMENEIAAPKAGVVKEIRVSEGATVGKRDVLAIIV